MTGRPPDPKALRAVDDAIKRADKNAKGDFDGVFGSLPKEAAVVLHEMLAYLRHYLLEERRLDETTVQRLAAQLLPTGGLHTVSAQAEDEGLKVALGVLNSIVSVRRAGDGRYKLDGQTLSKEESIIYLVSGSSGLRRHWHMKQQRANAEKGALHRTESRQQREANWSEHARARRESHPEWSDAELARQVARLPDVNAKASTIRQALPRLGLSKKPVR